MFERPKYVQAGLSVIFPRKSDIRRLANELEDVLKGEYNQPTILGVPDDFEAEVPRMIFESTHGFSQLAISQVAMSINVNFSADYQISSELRRPYLERKIPLLFKLLDICNIANPSFVGLNWKVRLEGIEISDKEVLQALEKFLLSDSAAQSLFDLEVKRVEVLEEKHFFNVSFTNYRQWTNDMQQLGIAPRPFQTSIGRGIQIVFDFNDRYSFNEHMEYHTSEETAFEILSKAYEISDMTLNNLTKDVE